MNPKLISFFKLAANTSDLRNIEENKRKESLEGQLDTPLPQIVSSNCLKNKSIAKRQDSCMTFDGE
jgi:hypothetical protein